MFECPDPKTIRTSINLTAVDTIDGYFVPVAEVDFAAVIADVSRAGSSWSLSTYKGFETIRQRRESLRNHIKEALCSKR